MIALVIPFLFAGSRATSLPTKDEFADQNEALTSLPPGDCTVVVGGVEAPSGTALVALYVVP